MRIRGIKELGKTKLHEYKTKRLGPRSVHVGVYKL